jgi:HSP20 family molecular chaperone IbpA
MLVKFPLIGRTTWFDDAFKEADEILTSSFGALRLEGVKTRLSGDDLVTTVDLPGVKRGDIKLTHTGELLTLCTKRDGKETVRTFSLDKRWDPSSAGAKLEDGVLTLTFKLIKNEEQRQKLIPIE